MWRWTGKEESTAEAIRVLATLTGTPGERISWSLTGSRAVRRTYVVNLKLKDVVIVTEGNNPLSIGLDGAKLMMSRFRLLKGDYEINFEGVEFAVGENMLVRLGQMRMKQTVLSEFCEIRWKASACADVTGAADELMTKLNLPQERTLVLPDFSKIPPSTRLGTRHTALQFVKLYEDVMARA